MTQAKKQPQSTMGETLLDDSKLEKLLEKREKLKAGVSARREADKEAKNALAGVEISGSVRVGRFVISKRTTQSRHVEFDTDAGVRLSIKADEE